MHSNIGMDLKYLDLMYNFYPYCLKDDNDTV